MTITRITIPALLAAALVAAPVAAATPSTVVVDVAPAAFSDDLANLGTIGWNVLTQTPYGLDDNGMTIGHQDPALVNLYGWVNSDEYQQLVNSALLGAIGAHNGSDPLQSVLDGPFHNLAFWGDQLNTLFGGPQFIDWPALLGTWGTTLDTLLTAANTGDYSNIDPDTLFLPVFHATSMMFSAFEIDAITWYNALTGSDFAVPELGQVVGPDGDFVSTDTYLPLSADALDLSDLLSA